jgi:hypothetical protein
MRGLGRLIALPWLLVALALQGLAPAQAQAMPRDAFGLPICSAQDAGGSGHRGDPSHPAAHDCCAAACALAALDLPTPASIPAPVRFAAALTPRRLHPIDGRQARAVWRPTARGPPTTILAA